MGLASTAPADSSFAGVSRLVEYEVRVTGPLVDDPLAAEGSIEWHQRGCCQPLIRSMHRGLQTIRGIIPLGIGDVK